jgi:membrane protease YdiL (CAAX protease family)
LISGVTIGAVFAFGEEYGWRGYLLPRLLPLGEFRASLLVGVIWAFWHTPALLAGLNYPGSTPGAAILVFVVVVTAMSFIFTRFFVASGGSVVVVAVLHGSFNSFNDRLIGPQHMVGNPLVVSMGLVAGALLVLAVVVIYALPRRLVSFSSAELFKPVKAQRGLTVCFLLMSGGKTHLNLATSAAASPSGGCVTGPPRPRR